MVSVRPHPPLPAPGGIEPGTGDLDEIERKRTVEGGKKRVKARRRRRGRAETDKGMKYLLNVIISNHL